MFTSNCKLILSSFPDEFPAEWKLQLRCLSAKHPHVVNDVKLMSVDSAYRLASRQEVDSCSSFQKSLITVREVMKCTPLIRSSKKERWLCRILELAAGGQRPTRDRVDLIGLIQRLTRVPNPLNWRCKPGLPVHIFCLSLSLFPYYFKWPVCVWVFFFSDSGSFFDIHLDWGFIKKPQTMEWLLIKKHCIWPLAPYPVVPSILLGRIHLFLN